MKNILAIIFIIFVISSCSVKNDNSKEANDNKYTDVNKSQQEIANKDITKEQENKEIKEEIGFDGKVVEQLINDGKKTEAKEILDKKYQIDAKNVEVLRLYAKLKTSNKEYEEALKFLLDLHKITKGENKQFLYDLAVAYSAVGKLDESEKYIKESLKIDPEYKYAKDYLKIIEEQKNKNLSKEETKIN